MLRSTGAVPIEQSLADAQDDTRRFRLKQVENVVSEMAIAAGLPQPRVYVVTDPDPNAFATGRDPEHASLAVTSGLVDMLNREELQAVAAHELSHVRNFDIRLMMVIAALVGAILYFTSGLVDTADAFFTAVRARDVAAARSHLAEDFKASTDEAALDAFLSRGAFLSYREASWSSRAIENGRGTLEGHITTDTGGVVPVKMSFVKENGAWKIYAIGKLGAGLGSDGSTQELPPKADRVKVDPKRAP